jgi:hypothetical protein
MNAHGAAPADRPEGPGGAHMVTDERNPSPGTREHLLRVTQLQCWGTIQESVDLCVRREAHW